MCRVRKESGMAKLVFGMNQSLDGYVDHMAFDGYRIYLHPVVLGHGKRYFAGPRPPLRLIASDRIGEDVIRLAYVPA